MSTVLSFDDTLGESASLVVRTYLSTAYLTSAAFLAQHAYAIEVGEAVQAGRVGLVERDAHHAYASGAIIMSALGVEAFVNELFADCAIKGKDNHFGLNSSSAEKLRRVWAEKDFQKGPSLLKYVRALDALELPRLNYKAKPVKAMKTLVELRNALAHYKMAIHAVESNSGKRAPTRLEKELQRYFPHHDRMEHNPMTGLNNAYIPDRAIGHAVAEWSAQTAVGFLEHFRELLSVTWLPHLRWPNALMLKTR
ncbi:hypothetical protein [Achromobacter sp.]|uniref:hypothetical protein n=1 Tax=Achromobacter sp. TaxID=134375 RepID=UPI0028A92EE8|nr:hypothetical protein [Achromobacter sp.]